MASGQQQRAASGLTGSLAWHTLDASICCTGRAAGDLGNRDGDEVALAARRRAVVDLPFTALRQVHGARVVTVTEPGGSAGEEADGAVTMVRGAALCVLTADCAPVGFTSAEGVIGVAHAGWRGLVAGVIEATVAAMRSLGATDVGAVLGPCIGPECYEFDGPELDEIAARYGDIIRGLDARGRPALDLPAAVGAAVAAAGATLEAEAGSCTACSLDYWSWRGARDVERQATVVWLR